jgi:glycerol-1-phosphatase
MVRADAESRPTYVGPDLRALYDSADTLRIAPHPAWRVDVGSGDVTVHSTGQDAEDALTVVRATASAVWSGGLDGRPFTITGGDDTARRALEQCALLSW